MFQGLHVEKGPDICVLSMGVYVPFFLSRGLL